MSEKKLFPNKAAADRNAQALMAEYPWMKPGGIESRVEAVMNINAGLQSKRRKLIDIVDEAGAGIAKHAACKSECSHCCKISVLIYQSEADVIGKRIGRAAQQLEFRAPENIRDLNLTTKYRGASCPFLIEEKCTVYDARPYVCRQQHSLDDTPDHCDLDKYENAESSVPHLNLKYLEFAIAFIAVKTHDALGDIREFFP